MVLHRRMVVVLGILAGLMISGPVMAMGMGDKIALSPEKKAVYDTLMKEHGSKIDTIKIHLWGKETELNALQGNPKVEPQTLSTLVKEATDLKLQLKAAEDSLAEALAKELGITVTKGGMCAMMGGGMMGGSHMGKGMMGKGMMGKGMMNMSGSGHENMTGSDSKAAADNGKETPSEHSTHPEKTQ